METADISRQKPEKEANPEADLDYRDYYFPRTERLGEKEMRVTPLGTGRPAQPPAGARAARLVELGNRDTFFFDVGSGCISSFASLSIPYKRANRSRRS